VSRDFWPSFFQQSTHTRAVIHGLKLFCIWLRICWEIRDILLKWSASAIFNETAEAASAVSMRPHKVLPQFQWDRGSWFGGFIETTDVAFVVSMRTWMRPRNPLKNFSNIIFPQKGSFHHKLCFKKFCFRGLNETAEAYSPVSMRPGKRIQRYQWVRGSRFSGLNETAEVASAISMRPQNPLWHSRIPCKNEYRLSIPLKGYYSKNKHIRKHNT
jgi:hypothetical protein